jgi:hypothetical protein
MLEKSVVVGGVIGRGGHDLVKRVSRESGIEYNVTHLEFNTKVL